MTFSKRLAALSALSLVALSLACAAWRGRSLLDAEGTPGADLAVPGGRIDPARLVHVRDTGALAHVAPGTGRVRRDGFATSGDGGLADYDTTAALCTLNSGAGDGGSQVGLVGPHGAHVGCAILDPALYSNASVMIWGAKLLGIGSDDTAAWNAAIAAMVAHKGGTIILPNAPRCSNITSPLAPITGDHVAIVGQGNACLNVGFAAGHAIQFGTDATAVTGDAIRNVDFQHNGVLHTAGADVAFVNAPFGRASDLIHNSGRFRGVEVDGGLDVWIDHDESRGVSQPGGSGLCVGCSLTSANPAGPIDLRVSQSNFVGNRGTGASASAAAPGGTATISGLGSGMEFQAAGGVFLDHINTDQNQVGMWVHPSGAYSVNGATYPQQVSAIFGTDIYVDSSTRWGILWDTSGSGQITNNRFSNLWVATCGSAAFPDACILHTGAGPQTNDRFAGVAIFNGQGPGVSVQSGGVASTDYDGTITGNNNVSGGAWSGIELAASVTHFGFRGRCGGPAGGVPVQNLQRYCMNVRSGATYISGEGDWQGNATGPLGLGLDASASNYDPHSDFSRVLPALTWTYTPVVSAASGALAKASAKGTFAKQGNIVSGLVTIDVTKNGSGGTALGFTLPFTPSGNVVLFGSNDKTKAVVVGYAGAGNRSVSLNDVGRNGYPAFDNTSFSVPFSYLIAQ